MGKAFYTSKTFWVNLLAIIASVAGVLGFDIGPELQAEIVVVAMGLVNIALRFVTKEPVNLS